MIFILPLALGAAITVILATVTGFPISTTHSITGALAGAGLVAIGTQLNFAALGKSFFLPLLLSPLIAVLLGVVAYSTFRLLRLKLGIKKAWCICVGGQQKFVPVTVPQTSNLFQQVITPDIAVDSVDNCTDRYNGKLFGISSQQLVSTAHFLSAGIVSFARGLNDTPKIVAIFLLLPAVSLRKGEC